MFSGDNVPGFAYRVPSLKTLEDTKQNQFIFSKAIIKKFKEMERIHFIAIMNSSKLRIYGNSTVYLVVHCANLP